MKLCDLLSVVESSTVFVYSNPSGHNDFNSMLLLQVDTYHHLFGKAYEYRPNTYHIYKNYKIVSISYGKSGIYVYVEVLHHGKV